jgi:hypothetical protein
MVTIRNTRPGASPSDIETSRWSVSDAHRPQKGQPRTSTIRRRHPSTQFLNDSVDLVCHIDTDGARELSSFSASQLHPQPEVITWGVNEVLLHSKV